METQWIMNILKYKLPFYRYRSLEIGANRVHSVYTFTRRAISSLLFHCWIAKREVIWNTPHINIMMHDDGPSKGRQTKGRRSFGTPDTYVDSRIIAVDPLQQSTAYKQSLLR
jgi:hypothetical protein